MILKSDTRGDGRQLATHLLNPEQNESIDIRKIVGFAIDTVKAALADMDTMARGAQTTKPINHVMLNPGKVKLTEEQWERAWEAYEHEFGLQGQPFVEVQHTKNGMSHQHRAYLRIAEDGTTINASFSRMRNEKVVRILEHEFGLAMTKGGHNKAVMAALRNEGRPEVADWMNHGRAAEGPRPVAQATHAEWQQRERTGMDAAAIRAGIAAAWSKAATGEDFAAELGRAGLTLARGDKAGAFVAVDAAGGAHEIGRALRAHLKATGEGEGVKAGAVRERLAEVKTLPTVAEATAQQADRLAELAAVGEQRVRAADLKRTLAAAPAPASIDDVKAEREDARPAQIAATRRLTDDLRNQLDRASRGADRREDERLDAAAREALRGSADEGGLDPRGGPGDGPAHHRADGATGGNAPAARHDAPGPRRPALTTPAGSRERDLERLAHAAGEIAAQIERQRKALDAPKWRGPDKQERGLAERYSAADARAQIQKDWPKVEQALRDATARLEAARQAYKDAGMWKRLVDGKYETEVQAAGRQYAQVAAPYMRMQRQWASPKAQKWAGDLMERGEKQRKAAEERTAQTAKDLTAAQERHRQYQELAEWLRQNPAWRPSPPNPAMTPPDSAVADAALVKHLAAERERITNPPPGTTFREDYRLLFERQAADKVRLAEMTAKAQATHWTGPDGRDRTLSRVIPGIPGPSPNRMTPEEAEAHVEATRAKRQPEWAPAAKAAEKAQERLEAAQQAYDQLGFLSRMGGAGTAAKEAIAKTTRAAAKADKHLAEIDTAWEEVKPAQVETVRKHAEAMRREVADAKAPALAAIRPLTDELDRREQAMELLRKLDPKETPGSPAGASDAERIERLMRLAEEQRRREMAERAQELAAQGLTEGESLDQPEGDENDPNRPGPRRPARRPGRR